MPVADAMCTVATSRSNSAPQRPAVSAAVFRIITTTSRLGINALAGRQNKAMPMPKRDPNLAAKYNDVPQFITVTQLAADLGITPRTLRFYENKGLITPSRIGTTRAYSPRDRARMVLILRGKRVGFSLKEIAEYLDLYDADSTGRSQNERLHKVVSARIDLLEKQRASLEEMLGELYEYRRHAEAVLGRSQAYENAESNGQSTGPSETNKPSVAKPKSTTTASARPERSRP